MRVPRVTRSISAVRACGEPGALACVAAAPASASAAPARRPDDAMASAEACRRRRVAWASSCRASARSRRGSGRGTAACAEVSLGVPVGGGLREHGCGRRSDRGDENERVQVHHDSGAGTGKELHTRYCMDLAAAPGSSRRGRSCDTGISVARSSPPAARPARRALPRPRPPCATACSASRLRRPPSSGSSTARRTARAPDRSRATSP